MKIHRRPTERHLPYEITQSYLPVCHSTQINAAHLNPARHVGTRFIYPGRMQGWVDLGVGYTGWR